MKSSNPNHRVNPTIRPVTARAGIGARPAPTRPTGERERWTVLSLNSRATVFRACGQDFFSPLLGILKDTMYR